MKNILFILGLLTSGLAVAQLDEYSAIESIDEVQGVWISSDSTEIQLFEEEDAPNGIWLVLYEDQSYFSSYMDPEMGASIDVQFDYTLNSHTFDCRLTMSNSMGYFMQHENQPFTFKLFYRVVNDETFLLLENDFGVTYELSRVTEL